MSALSLDVRLDGHHDPIGSLSRNDNGALRFQYRADYSGMPLSLSLPISDEPIGDVLTRSFFVNLLQERTEALEAVMTREGIARDDIAGLLLHLGKDCAGAISVLPAGAPPIKVPGDFAKDYDHVSQERVAEIVRSLHLNNRFPQNTQDPSPLAGVQNKFAITLLPNGDYAFPKPGSGAPTTHIIKVPKRAKPADAKEEAQSLRLSREVEIETIESELKVFGDIEALIVRRFDRAQNNEGLIIRLHQEDFAQALGLPRELKYERYGKGDRKFDTLAIARVLGETAEPAISTSQFIGAIFFDLLIGNTDAHAKNHALLYDSYRKPNLSPRYDLLPTRLDISLSHELPHKIGKALSFETITLWDIDDFLKTLGIATASGRKRISQNAVRKLSQDLSRNLDAVQKNGLKLFADLIASNIRKLCDIVGVEVPQEARNRDAFVSRGGGLLMGS